MAACVLRVFRQTSTIPTGAAQIGDRYDSALALDSPPGACKMAWWDVVLASILG
jgi:hypothetical protein